MKNQQQLQFGLSPLPWRQTIKRYLMQHKQALLWSVRKLTRMPLAALVGFLITAVSLALPVGLNWLLQNTQSIAGQWHQQETLSVYLRLHVTHNQAQLLLQQLRDNVYVAQASYISPNEGLKEFKQNTQLGDILGVLDENPLPGVIVLWPKRELSMSQLQALKDYVSGFALVQFVQFDVQWAKRLHAFIYFIRHVLYAFAFLLGIGVVLVISNTIRLSVRGHETEIHVLKFIGATAGYIRRPFLYSGVVMGLMGGLCAWLTVTVLISWLTPAVTDLLTTYDIKLALVGIPASTVGLLLLGGSGLGFLGGAIGIIESYKTLRSRSI